MAESFTEVASRVDIDELERGVLDFWERENIFAESVAQRADGKVFTFYDGPPYATGKPHYGHVLQSAIKDTVLRYKTMQGYRVPRRVGWDTHGLPVEVIVEKELGFKTKKDIEAFGIAQFNAKCREVVFRYIDEFTATLKRLGRWSEYDNPYATLDRTYMESEWWAFRQLWDKNLVYKDFRSTPYCIRCATPLSNFETGMAYKDRTDKAVYIKLKVKSEKLKVKSEKLKVKSEKLKVTSEKLKVDVNCPLSLLVWTTTPWTLPANVAVAYNKDLDYVTVVVGKESFILAKDRVEPLFGGAAAITKMWSIAELAVLTYEPLFPEVAPALACDIPPYNLVPAEHVTAEDGTGLVHMAPAFGTEDAEVGKKYGLPVLRTIDTNGNFYQQVPQWGGMNLFAANQPIAADLNTRGVLFKEEQYSHSYPHCWRCDEPLIYYALDTWFVRVTEFKQQLLAANEKINWIPLHIKEGRFKKGLESAPDWSVSRNRFWSVPVPVWECQGCQNRVCVGSVAELAELAGTKDVPDLHRPYVDELTWSCTHCSGTMQRIEEVLDVWFDSGSMQFAQWHYPFENKELVEAGSPADFIVESIEMTRAWFYVLHVLSVAIKGEPAFTNVIGSGIIFGADGNKLSKKLKNYPDIDPTLAKYGADTVRMFFVSSTFGEPYVFSENGLQELHRNLYQTLWNVYSFFVRYAKVQGWQLVKSSKLPVQSFSTTDDVTLPKSENVLDEWIMARLRKLEAEVLAHCEAYRFDIAARHFPEFVDDLSNWYVRRSRGRFQPAKQLREDIIEKGASLTGEGLDTDQAFATLYEVLVRVSKLLAPFMPFMSEAMYQNLTGEKSVHLELLPTRAAAQAAVTDADAKLLATMAQVRDVVSAGLALRAQAGIKVRQPLSEIIIPEIAGLNDDLKTLLVDELNVKQITVAELPPVSDGVAVSNEEEKVRVALVTVLTPELQAEGIAREIIRHAQQLRRKAGYALNDHITLMFITDNKELHQIFTTQQVMITQALQVDTVVLEADGADAMVEVKINGQVVTLGVKK